MTGPKPLLTEFGIHHRLVVCVPGLDFSGHTWTRIEARWAIQIGAENCDDFDSFAVRFYISDSKCYLNTFSYCGYFRLLSFFQILCLIADKYG